MLNLLNILKDRTKKITRTVFHRQDNISYLSGKYNILLPRDHRLPSFQKYSPLYDRFLPVLALFLPSNTTVIDIGANCGDTIAAMASCNISLKYFAIEADPSFYSFLCSNVNKIIRQDPMLNIRTCNVLVGKEVDSVLLTGIGGTKKAYLPNLDSTQDQHLHLRSKTLDAIIADSSINPAEISLLKVDTDGFDYDSINSAWITIKTSTPALFFECQFETQEQINGYIELINKLYQLGYVHWSLFDNFGGVIDSNSSLDQIFALIDYIHLQNKGFSTRTLWYIDILCCTDRFSGVASSALAEYSSLIDQGAYAIF
jgi:FkbM family methyltransferase